MTHRQWATVFIFFVAVLALPARAAETPPPVPAHGIALHGALKYPPGFTHFDYANPDAPKGGALRLAAAGTFDSLNPFVLKGVAAPGLDLVYQTLMTRSDDEAFSQYGLIAESVTVPPDRRRVTFTLRDEARWQDGKPVTAEDVVFSFRTLMDKGHPFYRSYYADVADVVAETPHRVTFTFKHPGNRELPLILGGELPILPRHAWAGKDFSASTLDPPLGSGPYRVAEVKPGQRIVYERVKNWWAENLPAMKGRHNFDTLSYDLYRDETVLLQALFAGNCDLRQENIAKAWGAGYDQPAVRDGRIRKEEIRHELPAGMQAFAFNTRRPMFADAATREALNFTFDFEWSNRQFAMGAYTRTQSYFANSELAATGLPGGEELEILKSLTQPVPPRVFDTPFALPVTSGTGQDMRPHLVHAKKLLEAAGWRMGASGLLERDGRPFRFEILLNSDAFQRWIAPMVANLQKLGIAATMRTVDAAQYQHRMDAFDYDMTVATFAASLSPGNEQRDYWGSAKASIRGSRNIIGVRNPAVDALVDRVISAPDRVKLVAAARALDRVLLWNYYVIPQWHINSFRLAWWDKFGRPPHPPKYGLGVPDTWWYDPEKAARVAAKTGA